MPTAKLIKSLSWSEKDLPQRDRTKHVHGMHPYFGKFVPQLVDYFLKRDLKDARLICDPFMGSGTTLVESNTYGIPSIGLDISKFNVMLCNVKTKQYDVNSLRKETRAILQETICRVSKTKSTNTTSNSIYNTTTKLTNSEYLNTWYHPQALRALLVFRDLIPKHKHKDVLKIILSRSARSSRMIAHYETDYPKKPQDTDYYCIKHDRVCHPTSNSINFLKRYCNDVVNRIERFQQIRHDVYTKAEYGDSRKFDFTNSKIDGVFTSPPYLGLIDYHEQHRYAYELLGLGDHSKLEIGPKKGGTSKKAIRDYQQNIIKTIKNVTQSSHSFNKNSLFIIVVNDRLDLYGDIVHDAGLVIKKRLCREVNRRSGRRATNFNEDILVCKLDTYT